MRAIRNRAFEKRLKLARVSGRLRHSKHELLEDAVHLLERTGQTRQKVNTWAVGWRKHAGLSVMNA